MIDQFNGDSWNGFNVRAEGIVDGESFSFSYNDGKGRIIAASGYMSWPDDSGFRLYPNALNQCGLCGIKYLL